METEIAWRWGEEKKKIYANGSLGVYRSASTARPDRYPQLIKIEMQVQSGAVPSFPTNADQHGPRELYEHGH